MGERPEGHIKKAIERLLSPLLGRPKESLGDTVQLALRNAVRPSRVLRLSFAFTPVMPPRQPRALKVEINLTERRPFYPIVSLPFRPHPGIVGKPVTLRSFDVDEMLATKLRALFQPDQGRDLFDLWWALTAKSRNTTPLSVDVPRVIAAFEHYMHREGSSTTGARFIEALERKTHDEGFRSDMKSLLRAGLSCDVDAAAALVKDTFLKRLPSSVRGSAP